MEKIPTAEEYWLKTSEVSDISKGLIKPSSCTKFMIEFAKLHVEQSLKAKIQAMKKYHGDGYSLDEMDAFTSESYPLETIR